MITTIGYVAGSLNQASLKVNSAAGFLGPADKVRAGGAARKLFSLKAFRAARRRTPVAARDIVLRAPGLVAGKFEVFESATGVREPCGLSLIHISEPTRPY